jgi:RNA polymerase sigma-70 factor (ECF subfamily)
MINQKQIEELKKGDRKVQKEVFRALSPFMLAVCRHYIQNEQDAEDIMIKGFFQAFTKIHQLDHEQSLKPWIKRIMINECLMFHRRNKKFKSTLQLSEVQDVQIEEKAIKVLRVEELFAYIDQLPDGYRTVFNLYCVEGYKHREIAEMLGISINTSKSQLILARKRLKKMIENEENITRNGTV